MSMQVTVPAHVGPGMTFEVSTTSGSVVTVTCPQGVVGGQSITIDDKGMVVGQNVVTAVPTVVPTVAAVSVTHPSPRDATVVVQQQQPRTIVVQQPATVVVQQQPQGPAVLTHMDLGTRSTRGICPNCKRDILTNTEKEMCTQDQCGVCCATAGIACWFCWPCLIVISPCLPIIFCINPDIKHTCPHCNYYIGTRLGFKNKTKR